MHGKCNIFLLHTKLFNSYSSTSVEIDYDDTDIECNEPLLEGAALTATSSLNERGPENARLNGEFFCKLFYFIIVQLGMLCRFLFCTLFRVSCLI